MKQLIDSYVCSLEQLEGRIRQLRERRPNSKGRDAAELQQRLQLLCTERSELREVLAKLKRYLPKGKEL